MGTIRRACLLILTILALPGCTKCDRYTARGICISDGDRHKPPLSQIEQPVDSAVVFWSGTLAPDDVESAVAGLWLRYIDDSEACNKWGCYGGGYIAGRMIVIPSDVDPALAGVRTRHEVGHAILQYASEVPWGEAAHHSEMCEAGFEWLPDC
jgi:hypothetical protein